MTSLGRGLIIVIALVAAGVVASRLLFPPEGRYRGTFTDGERALDGTDLVQPRLLLWGLAENLGATINSLAAEGRPSLNPAGDLLFFQVGRLGENVDLWMAEIDGGVVRAARPLREMNSPADDIAPACDGHFLYFASDRAGGLGGFDLYRAAVRGGVIGAPEWLGSVVNSESDDTDPVMRPLAGELYLASDRGGRGDFDIYVAATDGAGFGAPRLVGELSSPFDDREPAFSSDGATAWIASARAGGRGGFDLWRTTLDRGIFLPMAPVDNVNTPCEERGPWLSDGGFTLLFASDRPAGAGSLDLYRSLSKELYRIPELSSHWLDFTYLVLLLLVALLAWLARRWAALEIIYKCLILSLIVHFLLLLWFQRVEVRGGRVEIKAPGKTFHVRLAIDRSAGLRRLDQTQIARGERVESWSPAAVTEAPARTAAEVPFSSPGVPRPLKVERVERDTLSGPAREERQVQQVPSPTPEVTVGVPRDERRLRYEVEKAGPELTPQSLSQPVAAEASPDRRVEIGPLPPAPLEAGGIAPLGRSERFAVETPLVALPDVRALAPSDGRQPVVPLRAPPVEPRRPAAPPLARETLEVARRFEVDAAGVPIPERVAPGAPQELAAAPVTVLPMATPNRSRDEPTAARRELIPERLTPQGPRVRVALDTPIAAPLREETHPLPGGLALGPRHIEAPEPSGSGPARRSPVNLHGLPDTTARGAGLPPLGRDPLLEPDQARPELVPIPRGRRLPDMKVNGGEARSPSRAGARDSTGPEAAAGALGEIGLAPRALESPLAGGIALRRQVPAPLRRDLPLEPLGAVPLELRPVPEAIEAAPRVPLTKPPEIYRSRFGSEKVLALERFGGSSETERAVARGLDYLASIQTKRGYWGSRDRYDDKYGYVLVGKTGLCLLAFLGAGHTPGSTTRYAAVAERAVDFLLAVQEEASGHFGYTTAYSHGIATYALAECYALTRLERLRAPLERAVHQIVAAQHREASDRQSYGGWGYYYPDDRVFDNWPRASISAWQVMALQSARLGGIAVEDEVLAAAARFLAGCYDADRGAFRYNHDPERLQSRYPILPASTPAAVFALGLLGSPIEEPKIERAFQFILERRPREFRRASEDAFVSRAEANVYFWYYASLACFFRGGATWKQWNESLQRTLLPAQAEDGSWEPICVYARYAGDNESDKSYTTAMCVLMLEVYYRYFTPLLEWREEQ
ncbi:MAG: hypothetical protein AB1486_21930 [Planctomycetota bacterium]